MTASATAAPLRVAVIGAGRRGQAFALACAAAGFEVTLEDVMPARLRQAQDAAMAIPNAAPLRVCSTIEDAVRQADLAVDFMPDDLESKLEIVCMIDRMAPPRTILCTPTAALSISDLASCTYRPDRCFAFIGGPAEDKAAQVQVVHPAAHSADALESVLMLWRGLGYRVDVVADAMEPMLQKNVR